MVAHTLVLDGARVLLIPSAGLKAKRQNQAVLARARENGVPIVQAYFGLSLIVSKGEMVAYKWGSDQITVGVVDVPERPSRLAARACEKELLQWRDREMEKRYSNTMEGLAKKQAGLCAI